MGDREEHCRKSGEELIATAAAIAVALSKCMDNYEIVEFCELVGLVRQDLDIIKCRRVK